MNVISHSADSFRNLKNTYIEAHPSMNIIFGENGQGKTNILESIWLFTGCCSFRTHKNIQLVNYSAGEAKAKLRFFAAEREQTAEMKIGKTKDIVLNGSACESPRQMLGKFRCVVFSPSTLAVVKGSPGERRKLVDIALSLIKPNYAVIMSRYLRTLDQRNALIKKISENRYDLNILDDWDEVISSLGASIIKYRLEYIENLKNKSREIYSGISSAKEEFSVGYSLGKISETQVSENKERIKEYLLNELFNSRESDLKKQYTSVGPHSDDLIVTLNGKDARIYGSQGQQRSCALALKLGEASIKSKKTGEEPVVLLDDVMSELDEGRQKFILNYLNNWQVFITCCEPSTLMRSENGKVFEVVDGTVNER